MSEQTESDPISPPKGFAAQAAQGLQAKPSVLPRGFAGLAQVNGFEATLSALFEAAAKAELCADLYSRARQRLRTLYVLGQKHALQSGQADYSSAQQIDLLKQARRDRTERKAQMALLSEAQSKANRSAQPAEQGDWSQGALFGVNELQAQSKPQAQDPAAKSEPEQAAPFAVSRSITQSKAFKVKSLFEFVNRPLCQRLIQSRSAARRARWERILGSIRPDDLPFLAKELFSTNDALLEPLKHPWLESFLIDQVVLASKDSDHYASLLQAHQIAQATVSEKPADSPRIDEVSNDQDSKQEQGPSGYASGKVVRLPVGYLNKNEFFFDGKVRQVEEMRYSAQEIQARNQALLNNDLVAKATAYQSALSEEKARLLRVYSAEQIKEEEIEIDRMAVDNLAKAGLNPVSDLTRKVFSWVPETIRQFPIDYGSPATESRDLVEKSVRTLQWLVANARTQVNYSGGKDSSLVLYCLLQGMMRNRAIGVANYPVRILSAETAIEQPEMAHNLFKDHQAIEQWAKGNGLDISTYLVRPALSDQFQVAVIGGRKLPSFPSGSGDCSEDYKVKPQEKLRQAWSKEVPNEPIVSVNGMRLAESIRRAGNMARREDSDEKIVVSDDGSLTLSPIAGMSNHHVFIAMNEILMQALDAKESGLPQHQWPYPTDMMELTRIYQDSSGEKCGVVATQLGAQKSAGCGARQGCWLCEKVASDRSAEEMVKNNPKRYDYFNPLLQLRQYVADTQNDVAQRNWVGRTVFPNGLLRFTPDTYHPKFLHSLLRYMLTIEAEHEGEFRKQAQSDGFELPYLRALTLEQIFAIQFEWSRHGREARPFEALRIMMDVNDGGRFYPPKISAEEKRLFKPVPSAMDGFIKVGEPWVDYESDSWTRLNRAFDAEDLQRSTGLFDPLGNALAFEPVHRHHLNLQTGLLMPNTDFVEKMPAFRVDKDRMKEYVRSGQMDEDLHDSDQADRSMGWAAIVLMREGIIQTPVAQNMHQYIAKTQYLEHKRLTPATYDHAACVSQLVDVQGNPLQSTSKFKLEHYKMRPIQQIALFDMANPGANENSVGMLETEGECFVRPSPGRPKTEMIKKP